MAGLEPNHVSSSPNVQIGSTAEKNHDGKDRSTATTPTTITVARIKPISFLVPVVSNSDTAAVKFFNLFANKNM
jgi:hypothetical protein